MKIKFEYEAHGITDEGTRVQQEGNIALYPDDDPADGGEVMQWLVEAATDNFWTFAVEKAGHRDLNEITVSIKNIEYV